MHGIARDSMNQQDKKTGGQSLGRILLLLAFLLPLAVLLTDMPQFIQSLAIIISSSFCVVYVMTPLVIRIAEKVGAMDYPGERKIHARPTPRWGGIPVYAGVIVSLLLTSMHYMPNLKAMLIGSTLIFIVGLLDDVITIRATIRLLVQVAACFLLIFDGVHVTFLPDTWWGIAGEWIITIVWIVGITNAINFLDGMDGLLAGLVAGTSLIFFVLALLIYSAGLVDSPMLAYCALALFGSSICFLSFNVKPARIFLGDGGSNFFGFFLATMSIHGNWSKGEPLVSFFIPILILSVPIYDMVFTTVARIASGKVVSFKSWLEFTGRDHIHHRLEALGLSRGWVVAVICFLNMAIGVGAITLFEARTYGGVALIVQAVCVYIVVAVLEVLGRRKITRNQVLESLRDDSIFR